MLFAIFGEECGTNALMAVLGLAPLSCEISRLITLLCNM